MIKVGKRLKRGSVCVLYSLLCLQSPKDADSLVAENINMVTSLQCDLHFIHILVRCPVNFICLSVSSLLGQTGPVRLFVPYKRRKKDSEPVTTPPKKLPAAKNITLAPGTTCMSGDLCPTRDWRSGGAARSQIIFKMSVVTVKFRCEVSSYQLKPLTPSK